MISKSLLFCLLSLLMLIQEVYAQKFDAEVIEYKTLCEASTGKLTKTVTVTIQINNRVGDKYTEISIPY